MDPLIVWVLSCPAFGELGTVRKSAYMLLRVMLSEIGGYKSP